MLCCGGVGWNGMRKRLDLSLIGSWLEPRDRPALPLLAHGNCRVRTCDRAQEMGEIYITLDGLREWIGTVASGRGARGASCGL